MSQLWERIVMVEGRPTLKSSGRSVVDVVGRLESGDSATGVADGQPLDVVAALAFSALGDDSSQGCSLVQGPPSRPRLAEVLSEAEVGRLFPKTTRVARLALSAGLLQVHDFWEASHEAAQEAEDLGERRFSAYWHGIAHRREPDAGNAAYWFRRVGKHALFPALAEAARPLLEAYGDDRLTARLTGSGGWDASAMIDVCTRSKPGTDQDALIRRLQRLEMKLLLDATAAAV